VRTDRTSGADLRAHLRAAAVSALPGALVKPSARSIQAGPRQDPRTRARQCRTTAG
jgi:hypothetical protein